MHRFLALLIGLIGTAAPALADPPRPDAMLAGLDQLMIARSVEARCGQADATTDLAFQRQYRAASEQGVAALKILASELTLDHVEKIMTARYLEIDRQVGVVIAQESCESTRIKEALQKYDTVANSTDIRLVADKNN